MKNSFGDTQNILQVAHLRENVGGPFTSSINLHLALHDFNTNNSLMVLGDKNVGNRIKSIRNANAIEFTKGMWNRVSIHWLSLNFLSKFYTASKKFDHVHFHGFFIFNNIIMLLICKIRGISISIQPHGSLMEYEFRNSARLKAMFIYFFLIVTEGITVNYIVTSKIELDQLPNKIIDTGKSFLLTYQESEIDEVRSEIDQIDLSTLSNKNQINVLFMGRITPKKNLLLIARAIHEVNLSGGNFDLVCVGPLEDKEKINMQFIEELLGRNFHYLGPIYSELAKRQVMESCHIFALPSLGENFSLSAMEANRAGLFCILSHNIGSIDALNPQSTLVLKDLELDTWVQALIGITKLIPISPTTTLSSAQHSGSWSHEAVKFLNFISVKSSTF